MTKFEVIIRRKRGLRQQYHVLIRSAGNHEPLFTSENFRNAEHARVLAAAVALPLGAKVHDES